MKSPKKRIGRKAKAEVVTPQGADPLAAVVAAHKKSLEGGEVIFLPEDNRFLMSKDGEHGFDKNPVFVSPEKAHLVRSVTVNRVLYALFMATEDVVQEAGLKIVRAG